MKILKAAIDSGDFDNPQISEYKFVRESLSYSGNIVIRQDQIVPPCLPPTKNDAIGA